MGIGKMISEKFNRINEARVYNYKSEAMTDYFKGKLTAKEVIGIANDIFHTEVATKKELHGFLDNKFMQGLAAEQFGIDVKILVKKAKELLMEL